MSTCLVITSEIRELSNKFPGETPGSIKTLIELWQEANNKGIEDYPSASELNKFRSEIRSKKDDIAKDDIETEIISAKDVFSNTPQVAVEQQKNVDLVFDPQKRLDRVSLIAQLVSKKINDAINENTNRLVALLGEAEDAGNMQAVKDINKQISNLNRLQIIKELTPQGLFKQVYDMFKPFTMLSEEQRVQTILDEINGMKGSERFSHEQKLASATKKATYRFNEYNKVIDNFYALAEEASGLLVTSENIRIDPTKLIPSLVNSLEEADNIDESNNGDKLDPEEDNKDGWMTNYREVSSHDSLGQEVRKAISQVPRLTNKGVYDKDDLGFVKYLDSNYVHAVLIDKLRNMITSDDMIPLLKEAERMHPWIKQITKLLESNETLYSQFYQDFRKDFTPYWIQKKKLKPDGTYSFETISINTPEGVYYMLDSWRDSYEYGDILDKDSVYTKSGEINNDGAKKGLEIVKELMTKFNNLQPKQSEPILNEPEIWDSLLKVLRMIGINTDENIIKNALTDFKEIKGAKVTDPIVGFLNQVNIIYDGINKNKITNETNEDGEIIRGDLINTFGTAYSEIASTLAKVVDDAIESSVRENGKSYYSHTTPNYLGKLIKNLKNVMNDKERFDKFIQNEYKKYDWFYKGEKFRNGWLADIVEDASAQAGLQHKVVLSSDKIGYTDWDSLDYATVMLNEYLGDPDSKNSREKWAWYHVPILSDAPSAEFIRFKRYTDNDSSTYKEVLLDKLADIVEQEFDRIMLVRQRAKLLSAGDPSVSFIANFDMKNEKNLGGAEFKFLPSLNNVIDNGNKFVDILGNQTLQPDDLIQYIKDTLSREMDREFEEVYKKYIELGLLDKNNDGNYLYLNVGNQNDKINRVKKAIMKAREVLGTNWNSNLDIDVNKFMKDEYQTPSEINSMLSSIKEAIDSSDIKDSKRITQDLKYSNPARDLIQEYFWNSKYATSQIIQLTTTDLAYYKNIEDFQKRYKEVHAPALRMNTKAMFNGELIGRETERTIYLQDDEIVSNVYGNIKEVLDAKVKSNEMSKTDADYILSKYEKVNVADAQAYRSLDSYKAIMAMSGQWTEEMERAKTNFEKGIWNMADFSTIWQTKKPYLYTQVGKSDGVNGRDIKVPIQHKNSEFLLLALHNTVAASLNKSDKLKAINKFMIDNNIDVVQFESTTKVGKMGTINLNGVDSFDDVINVLENTTDIKNGGNPNVVHEVPYEDYGIQTATPEHVIDAIQLVGTQIRKLITADIADDAEIEIDGNKMTKRDFINLYNEINTENILTSFMEVNEIFSNPEMIESVLQEEIRGNKRYGNDMLKACTLIDYTNPRTGKTSKVFNIPLFDPVQSIRVQSLLNSIIKSRVTKQKIRGGALIQVSDYGLTKELNVRFSDNNGDLVFIESEWNGDDTVSKKDSKRLKESKETYDSYEAYKKATKSKSIAYLEIYMPAYSKQFYEPLMKEGTHELDIDKLPEDLRRAIGYRVPTEDKYSMAPLRIKGFLPQQNGSAIMLPAEITTLSGSDFDVDKLYIMLPEFNISKRVNRKTFIDNVMKNEGFRKWGIDNVKMTLDMIENGQIDFSENTPEMHLYDYYTKVKDALTETKINKIKYDYDKPAYDNSLKARNNALIDMMWGILTNKDTATKVLNPGGFDAQKKAARIITLLKNNTPQELSKMLNTSEENILSSLEGMDLDKLDKIVEAYKVKLDPISPLTQIEFHKQNMTGGKMIGVYANQNANHAIMQHTGLAISDANGGFTLNNEHYTSLHSIKNNKGEFISRNNAGFLAASVDNVKDPVLAGLNQNLFTADASMLLSRLGYSPLEIGLVMSQPIVEEITKKYLRESRSGKSKDSVVKEVLKEYQLKTSFSGRLDYDNFKNNKFLAEDLAKNIMISDKVKNLTDRSQTSDFDEVNYYQNQLAVGYLFQRIMKDADALALVVGATRADTGNGAAGPDIATSINKIQKVQSLMDSLENPEFALVGAGVITNEITTNGKSKEALRKELLNKPLPYIQAFYSLGLQATSELFSKYFPQFNPSVMSVVNSLKDMTKSGSLDVNTMNSVFSDILAYVASKNDVFGGLDIDNASSQRDAYINNFPGYFMELKNKNSKIASLGFIQRLKFIKPNDKNPVATISFKNVGSLNTALKERYMRDWQSLLYMDDIDANKLAIQLFLYSYYRSGFSFGPSSFIHLAPVAVRQAIPGYISSLRGMMDNIEDDYSDFINQYVFNHLDNRKLVPEITKDSTFKFIQDGKILDEVVISVNQDSSIEDRKVIKTESKTNNTTTYELMDFIGVNIKGKFAYYMRVESTETGETATYSRIEPLGYKNNFLEYQYGVSAISIKSVIANNDRNYNPNKLGRKQEANFLDHEFSKEAPSDWQDYNQRIYSSPEFQNDANLAYEAFKQVLNESFEQAPISDDMLSYEPNTDTKDADGEIICVL